MTKQEVLQDIDKLCDDIDKWITKRYEASLKKDAKKEAYAYFTIENILIVAEQKLSYLRDYIEENVKENRLWTTKKE